MWKLRLFLMFGGLIRFSLVQLVMAALKQPASVGAQLSSRMKHSSRLGTL